MSAEDDITTELRGFSDPDDVETEADAALLLDLEQPVSEDDADSRFTELTLEYHPDTGGSTELFQAIDKAHKILIGERVPEAQRGPGTGAGTDGSDTTADTGPSRTGPGGGTGGTGTGRGGTRPPPGDQSDRARSQASGPSQEEFNNIVSLIRDYLQRARNSNPQIDQLIEQYGLDNLAEVLSSLIVSGSIDLGDVEKIVGSGFDNIGSGKDERFGGGGDERFGRGPTRDDRFGRGDSRFG